ncbi:spore coat protein CotJB [Clostridium sp. P21]|uniref:Spore coat protein CotJB n=2 Tax=Clostridium muellerianum TaxID=2716538 RepID=A0A7Y0EFC5_9CLOT|nr:spore coat protein CotJB [Clostridium muellerianum]
MRLEKMQNKWQADGKMDRMELLKQITATCFMKEDLSLYLNTHPTDQNAIAKYNFYVMQGKKLKEKYEMHYGMLTENSSCSPRPWQWINEPWPWEPDANFQLNREGM